MDLKLEKEAYLAIHAIGTNCIPTLTLRLRLKDNPVRQKIIAWLLKARLLDGRTRPLGPEIRRGQALTALLALAPLEDVDAIVPDLLVLSHDSDANARTTALFALQKIRPWLSGKLPGAEQ